MVGVMITNGPGGHPAWKHANVTAAKIVQIDPGADEEKQRAANTLRGKLEQELTDLHENQKQHELKSIREQGSAQLMAAMEPHWSIVDQAMAKLDELTKGTVLEEHYQDPEVRRIIRDEIIASEFATQVYIHRSEHANEDRDNPHARNFMARFSGDVKDILDARHEHAALLAQEAGTGSLHDMSENSQPQPQRR